MEEANSRRARRELAKQQINSHAKMSKDARDWLTLAVDPYHDYQHQVAGYPDADTSSTIVSCYNYALDIAAPVGVVGNWDAHVFSLPRSNVDTYNIGTLQPSGKLLTSANTINLGFLNVITADGVGGPQLFPTSDAWAPTHKEVRSIGIPFDGQSRVIGAGFEVINTTAEMYLQGNLTAYKMPQVSRTATVTVDKTTSTGQVTAAQFRCPPATASQALLLSGTRQWKAKEGAYVTLSQSSVENPIVPCVKGFTLLTPDALFNVGDMGMLEVANPFEANSPPAVSMFSPGYNKVLPFNVSGVYLTGLSASTTLRVTLKVFIEKAPTFSEPELAVLATPSAPYDDRALKLYSAIWTKLPVAVPVNENSFGDWWKRILGVVSAVAGPIGLATGNPIAGAAISGASAGLSSVFDDEAPAVNRAVPRMQKLSGPNKAGTLNVAKVQKTQKLSNPSRMDTPGASKKRNRRNKQLTTAVATVPMCSQKAR